MESSTEVSKTVGSACVGVLLVFLMVSSVASAQLRDGSLRSMGLLTPETGWALTDRLLWTTDGGIHWKDITPRVKSHQIAAVFFLDTSTGWMLLARTTDSNDALLGFDVASTVDSGADWTVTPVRISSNTDFSAWGNSARVDFVDALHGWILFSAGARSSSLIATEDGGKNWHNLSSLGLSEEGVYGPIHFVSIRDGWLTNGYWLYRTRDGGNSWQEISLKAPPAASPATRPAYNIPTFRDSQHGLLPVTYSIAYLVPQPHSAFVLFATEDGGQTWKPHRILSNLKSMAPGTTFPSSVTDSIVVAATSDDGRRLTLMNDTTGTSGDVGRGVSQLGFVDIARGWTLTTDGYLFSTNDAGATWTDITPGRPQAHPTQHQTTFVPQPFWKTLKTLSTPLAAGVASVSRHLGFDEFSVPQLDPDLLTWWTESPYFDIGLYLNGAFTHSTQDPLLSSSWVSGALTQGWGLWPHWEDYQAFCDSYTNKINPASATNYAAARAQGKHSADCAALSAGGITLEGTGTCDRATCSGNVCSPGVVPTAGLGLAGHIIYYDLEPYTPSALVTDPTTNTQVACGASVNAFLDAWITEIQTKGFLAGVYGTPVPATSWHTGGSGYKPVSHLPNDVWIAAYRIPNLPGRATTWGLAPLSDAYWTTDQRIHQYTNTHDETWESASNTVTLSIDNDIEDAQIARGSGTKTYAFAFKSFDCFFSTYTQPLGVNSQGLIVGYYQTAAGLDQGFTYNGTTCTSVSTAGTETLLYGVNNAGQYVGTIGHKGYLFKGSSRIPITCDLFSTVPQAINDDGQVAGYYEDSSGIEHGFLWNPQPQPNGTCTFPINVGTIASPLEDKVRILGIDGFANILGMYESSGGSCTSTSSTGVCSYGFLKNAYPGAGTAPVAVAFPSGAVNCDFAITPPPPCYSLYKVNNNEEMVGTWTAYPSNTSHGFLDVKGHFTNIDCPSRDCPNVTNSYAFGISETQIVGSWLDTSFHTHGFVATRK